MKRLLLIVMLMVAAASHVSAQESTVEPTATETPTPTPEVYAVWTLPAPDNPEGTPQPGQAVMFAYTASVGEVGIMLFLLAILFSLWAMFISYLLFRRRAVGGG